MASTQKEEPKTFQPSSAEVVDDKVWIVAEKPELSVCRVTPKTQHQTKEKEEEEEEERDEEKGRDRQQKRDVYSFPGDSDPESPPPAPWAQCTFVQRRRKKRALLRPFSGLAGKQT